MKDYTDLHTHILPGIDDGARDPDESIALLRQQAEQGVRRVALTPHFYPRHESAAHFLSRRAKAYDVLRRRIDALQPVERDALPELLLGAEVAWAPELTEETRLDALRLGGSGPLLLELPFERWGTGVRASLYELAQGLGGSLLLAHLERYQKLQSKEIFEEVLSLGLAVQLSAAPLTHTFARGALIRLLKRPGAWLIASDCHRPKERPADLARGFAYAERSLGTAAAAALEARARALWEI